MAFLPSDVSDGRLMRRTVAPGRRAVKAPAARRRPAMVAGLLRHQSPELLHRRDRAELSREPLERAPQHRLIAVDDRLAERELDVLDRLDLRRVGTAQEKAVGVVARI